MKINCDFVSFMNATIMLKDIRRIIRSTINTQNKGNQTKSKKVDVQ